MADGMEKNLEVVKEGWADVFAEWKESREKVADAIANRDILDALHHLSDFRGAAMQHAWRTWFYLFWAKWLLVGVLIWQF